jgi:hypothetical protein
VTDVPLPIVLFSTQYQQRAAAPGSFLSQPCGQVINFAPVPQDLAFDDAVLDRVKTVWLQIMGDGAGDFLVFEDREVYDDEDE